MKENILETLPGVEKDVPLASYTTYQIGGCAKYFFVAKNNEQIVSAIAQAKKYALAVLVLGGGSNLLVSDQGFDGLVIKIENGDYAIDQSNQKIVEVGAGAAMDALVKFSIDNALQGLEWAGGLPGTFGGAVRGNAGAFAGEIKDSIMNVCALDEHLSLKTLSRQECQFDYRTSIFKKRDWIVLSAAIKLQPGDKEKLWKIARSHMAYRKEKQPLEYPNAGSVFQNCPLSDFSKKFQTELLHVVKQDPFPVVPTAYLISEAGLKGLKIGNAQISEKHPNFIVNLGGARAQDIIDLIAIIKAQVKKKFGVELCTEVQFVGF